MRHMEAMPARMTPVGMKPLTVAEMPLPTGLEVSLELLDGLVQQMASRVNRIVSARAAATPEREHDPYAKDDEAAPIEIAPVLRMFTELPPEFTFKMLRDARADLEMVVSKHKEVQGDDGAA